MKNNFVKLTVILMVPVGMVGMTIMPMLIHDSVATRRFTASHDAAPSAALLDDVPGSKVSLCSC